MASFEEELEDLKAHFALTDAMVRMNRNLDLLAEHVAPLELDTTEKLVYAEIINKFSNHAESFMDILMKRRGRR